MAGELLEIRRHAHIEHFAGDSDQGRIADNCGDAGMKGAVGDKYGACILHHAAHRSQRLVENGNVFRTGAFCCFLRYRAFDDGACLQQFERAFCRLTLVAGHFGGVFARYVDAGAHANVDVAFDFKHDQRLAQRRARNRKLLRKLPLGGKPLADDEFAPDDHQTNLICHLPVKAA